MKFDPKEEQDSRVREAEGWLDDLEDLPAAWGVFVVVDDKDDVKYIGRALGPTMRAEAEAAQKKGLGKSGTKIGCLMTFSPEKAQTLHDDLVAKYKPADNK